MAESKLKSIVTATKPYLLAVLLCMVLLTMTMQLWKADFHVPFSYALDSLFYSTIIKGTIENGWYLQNDSLGAPGELRMHDFPMPDTFNFVLIRFLALIKTDYAWVLNVFFLLTFPLTTVCCLFALRQFQLTSANAVVWSLIYTFIPYHFYPGINHLFQITYFTAPLSLVVALWISSGQLISPKGDKARLGINIRSRRFIVSVLICAFASLMVGFAYYAFFTCFFFLIGGLVAVSSRRRIVYLLPAVILIAVVVVGVIGSLAPNLIYLYKHGDAHVAKRAPGAAELYGLKIAPMLLPVRNHRISGLASVTEDYLKSVPKETVETSEMSALGFLGSAGFLFLVAWLLFFFKTATTVEPGTMRATMNTVSVLNCAAVLLATIGGFSSLVALVLVAQIRSYHRISLFIAFLCVLALGLLIEECFRRRFFRRWWIRYAVLFLILIFGIFDQTTAKFVPDYAQNKGEFTNDEAFVRNIESRLPARAMVFQLPYVKFPEGGSVNLLTDYELFRGYLHSRNLRWSYGAMKGREADIWLEQISAQPLPDLLESVTLAGFQGIYIDRLGYKDRAADLENHLSGVLKQRPLVSDNQRLAFFDLSEFSKQVRQQYSPSEWSQKREDVLYPVVMTWGGGCWDREGTESNNWHWCSNTGELKIANYSKRPRRLEIEMELYSGHPQPSQIRIQGAEISDAFLINDKGRKFTATITVPPGNSPISFASDAQSVPSPGDGRNLVFRVVNFRWKAL